MCQAESGRIYIKAKKSEQNTSLLYPVRSQSIYVYTYCLISRCLVRDSHDRMCCLLDARTVIGALPSIRISRSGFHADSMHPRCRLSVSGSDNHHHKRGRNGISSSELCICALYHYSDIGHLCRNLYHNP